jgi:segregation and condensation protein B
MSTVPPALDVELSELPPALRWREWMGRVEAAIFTSAKPVPREVLAMLVGREAVLDELIGDIQDELKARPYELVFVSGGWQHRTRPRFAQAVRASAKLSQAHTGSSAAEAIILTATESLVLAAIAYHQPIGRAQLTAMLGREISRDTLALLKRRELIGAGPRMAQPGAPLTYVTTPTFLSVFGLATLRDLPEMEAIQDASTTDIDVMLPGSLGDDDIDESDDGLLTNDASFVLERDESLND